MKPETSLYIDALRIAAVLLVFINHAKRTAFTGGFLDRLGVYGQEAVAVFFVLSGLVISHVTLTRPGSLRGYAVARLARLWSVVVPAIVLTVVLDSIGFTIDPDLYHTVKLPGWGFDQESVWRALSPALFLNSVPPFGADVGSNGPFWSLSYEAWYYAAFGMAVFLSGWRRLLALGLVAWFVGPEIRLLAPLWLLGVAVQAMIGRGGPSAAAWLGWVGSLAALAVLFAVKYRLMAALDVTLPALQVTGISSAVIVEKYGAAILIAVNIVCFDRVAGRFAYLCRILDGPIRAIAARSFSIYLYQAPLLFFVATLCPDVTSFGLRVVIFYGGTLSACVVLAEMTERQKHVLVRWMNALPSLRFNKARAA